MTPASFPLSPAAPAAPRQQLLGAAAVLLAFSLSLPTAGGSVATVLFLLAWLTAGGWQLQWRRWRASPTAIWATALLGMFLLGISYSSATTADLGNFAGKYAKLLLLPAIIAGLSDVNWRRRALLAFLAGTVLASTLSYARFAGWIPERYARHVVQGHIHFGVIEAFAAYWFARLACERGPRRWLLALLAAMLAFDVIYIDIARTGYVVLFALIVLLAAQRLGRKGVALGAATALVLALVAFTAFPIARTRVQQGWQNLRQYQRIETTHSGSLADNSLGLRLQFWRNTWRIIERRPLLGSGTGSLPVEYGRIAPHDLRTSNAHNEYLNTTEQLGLVGLVLLLGLGVAAWREARRLDASQRDAAQAVLVTIGVGSLFNSLLMDVNEGRFLVVMLGLLLAAASSGRARERSPRCG